MTNAKDLEVQIVDYKKDYQMNLEGYNQLEVNYEDDVEKKLFENILACKIYGIDHTVNEQTREIEYTYYDEIEYSITYGAGATTQGDIPKCIFGLINNFKGIRSTSKKSSGSPVNVEIKDMYFFIFAHKTGDQEMNEVNQNQLRVYKVLKMDNTHIVDPMSHIPTSCWGNSNGYTDCGLFAGSVSNDTNDCILGFKYDDKEEQWYFYLPTLSYCLEGRTEDMINFGENYKGYFKINLPKLIE